MPKGGNNAKSVEEKRLLGTLRPDDHQVPLIIGGRSLPEPSDFLTDVQTDCFNEFVNILKAANILDRADAGMIELAAIEKANVIACNDDVDQNGIVITGAMGGVVTNPAGVSRGKSLVHLRQLYQELGIGPASRARLQNLGVITGVEPAAVIVGIGDAPELRVVSSG